jgi:hypothetical protein
MGSRKMENEGEILGEKGRLHAKLLQCVLMSKHAVNNILHKLYSKSNSDRMGYRDDN